jgi:hypothetical protein
LYRFTAWAVARSFILKYFLVISTRNPRAGDIEAGDL